MDVDSNQPLGSAGRQGRGLIAQLLVWAGVLLLLVGGMLAYPHVRSRLAAPLPAPAATPSVTLSSVPTPTCTRAAFMSTPSSSPSPFPTPPAPTSTSIPSPTPTPALPSRIVISAIGVDAPVVPVSWQEAQVDGQTQAAWGVPDMYAAGWHETSAPLGVPGNTVLNGHNTNNGEIFRRLYTMDVGDTIILYAGDAPYTYTVSEMLILPEGGQPLEVRLENARHILPTDDERLTIVTCHPYGSLRNRLVVIARPIRMTNRQRQ